MNTHSKTQKTIGNLYDFIHGDEDDFISEEAFENKVEELVSIEMMEKSVIDDNEVAYSCRPGLVWSDFCHLDDPIKKQILLVFVENPTTFFVLQNTQKGKSKIICKRIEEYSNAQNMKAVGFVITDNDKTLSEFAKEGIENSLKKKVRVFHLSSASKNTLDETLSYMDAYAYAPGGRYAMPLIILLANAKQWEKAMKLMHHIILQITEHASSLRYFALFDEADKTYPVVRNQMVSLLDGTRAKFIDFVEKKDFNQGLCGLGFVTATDGDLIETEDYPECANAHLYHSEIDEMTEANYQAVHLPGAVLHRIPMVGKTTHNVYAEGILVQNKEHFTTPIQLPSGELYYRKIIVNSNARTRDMDAFARMAVQLGMYAMVFNGHTGTSIKLYRGEGHPVLRIKTTRRRFNEVLFYVYKIFGLSEKPLVIIGRRKVDRGLSFHFAPRTPEPFVVPSIQDYGDLTTSGMEGIIWTDIILGQIEDKNTAVQKAGRGAGIIAHCPQFPGSIEYWAPDSTLKNICTHNQIVDETNQLEGCSALQAFKRAEHKVLSSLPPPEQVNHDVNLKDFLVYNNEATVRAVCTKLGYKYRTTKENASGFRETSLNAKKGVASLLDAIKKVPTAYGGGARDTVTNAKPMRSCLPCYKDIHDKNTLHFVVVLRPGTDEALIEDVKTRFPSILVPQRGVY